MNIFYEIEKLVYYGLKHSLIEDEDRILIRNEILEVLEMDDFQELSETELYSLKEELESTEYPSEILRYVPIGVFCSRVEADNFFIFPLLVFGKRYSL